MKKIVTIITLLFIILGSINNVNAIGTQLSKFTAFRYKGITRSAYTSNVGRKVSKIAHTNMFYNSGTWLYCVENGQKLNSDSAFNQASSIDTFLSKTINTKTTVAQKKKWLSVLLAIAPRTYSGDPKSQSLETNLRYCAAATIVWEIMDEVRDKDFNYIGADSGKKAPRDGLVFTTTSIKDQYYTYYNQYVNQIMHFYDIPSFTSSSSSSAPIYEAKYNPSTKQFELQLNDSKQVLSSYNASAYGASISCSSNKLTLSLKNRIKAGDTLLVSLADTTSHRTSALLGYLPNTTSYQKLMCAGSLDTMQTRSYFKVKTVYGSLELTKSDQYSSIVDGAVFSLSNNSGYNEQVTVSNGKLFIDYLSPGTYLLKEVKAPTGYLLDNQTYQVTIYDGQTTKMNIINEEPLGEIHLQKKINGLLIGDSYLKDNEFGLYAKEDIVSPQNQQVYFKKGELITQKSTDENGQIIFDQLPLGQYLIKEIKSNDSLLLNDNEYEVTLSYQDQYQSLIIDDVLIENDIHTQDLLIEKKTQYEGIIKLEKHLSDASFVGKLESDVQEYGWQDAPTYFEGTTDEDGKLLLTDIPYGTYRIKEVNTPDGYQTSEDMIVELYCQDETYPLTIMNKPIDNVLSILKVDEYDEILEDAHFQLIDKATGEIIDDWVSTNEPHIIESLVWYDTYILREIEAPIGYIEMNDIEFVMDVENKQITCTNFEEIEELGDEPPLTSDSISIALPITTLAISAIYIYIQTKKKVS